MNDDRLAPSGDDDDPELDALLRLSISDPGSAAPVTKPFGEFERELYPTHVFVNAPSRSPRSAFLLGFLVRTLRHDHTLFCEHARAQNQERTILDCKPHAMIAHVMHVFRTIAADCDGQSEREIGAHLEKIEEFYWNLMKSWCRDVRRQRPLEGVDRDFDDLWEELCRLIDHAFLPRSPLPGFYHAGAVLGELQVEVPPFCETAGDQMAERTRHDILRVAAALRRFPQVVIEKIPLARLFLELFDSVDLSTPRTFLDAFLGRINKCIIDGRPLNTVLGLLFNNISNNLESMRYEQLRRAPEWNTATGTLKVDGEDLHTWSTKATNVRLILDEFESNDWPPSINNPLIPSRGMDAASQTIRHMNKFCKFISFHVQDCGKTVYWVWRIPK